MTKGGLERPPFVSSSADVDLILIVLIAIRENERQHAGLFFANSIELAPVDAKSFEDGYRDLRSHDRRFHFARAR